jgi:hypothetical protein
MDNMFDENCRPFITLQWKLAIHALFEMTEKTQGKALKDLACVWRRHCYSYLLHGTIKAVCGAFKSHMI